MNSIHIGVCDKLGAGTDSSISVKFCSMERCCSTGVLDKVGNDFERGDWMFYESHEMAQECRNFPISTKDVRVFVRNRGKDALCINRFQVRSWGRIPKILRCYMPLDPEFWVESESLQMTCD